MASFNYPFNIVKNTPAIAGQVQTNFNDLLTWVMANLIQRDGTVAMTGPLVLAPGEPASPDHAANKAYVDAVIPIGIVWEYAGTSLPTGWLWADGATYSNTSQPRLAAALGRNFTDAAVPAGSFQVPDKRKRVSVGADPTDAAVFGLGKKGGQRDSELQVHSHAVPAHGHTASGATNGGGWVDHLHHPPSVDDNQIGDHDHNMGHGRSFYWNNNNDVLGVNMRGPGDQFWAGLSATTWLNQGSHNHDFTVGKTGPSDRDLSHNHPLTVTVNNAAAFATQDAGNGTTLTDKNLPPYIAVNYIIYAGT
jgi:microcystin-dependent protein